MNALKTTALLAALTGLFVAVGRALGGDQGMVLAFGLALAMNFVSYFFSDRIVLAMYRARPVTPAQAPELYRMVESLAREASMPMPKVYVVEDPSPNAFATGRSPAHAAVAVTTGILDLLSERELRGVLGHELSHVLHRDTLVSTIAATIAGAISMLAHWAQWALWAGRGRDDDDRGGNPLGALLAILVAPIAASLIQLAVSRSREYAADLRGAKLHGNPLDLAAALEKIAVGARREPMHAEPATAHLFIVNPLTGGGLSGLFSTHPPTAERVKRLRALARLTTVI